MPTPASINENAKLLTLEYRIARQHRVVEEVAAEQHARYMPTSAVQQRSAPTMMPEQNAMPGMICERFCSHPPARHERMTRGSDDRSGLEATTRTVLAVELHVEPEKHE